MTDALDKQINELTVSILLEKLSEDDREAIHLWLFEGFSLREVSQILSKKYFGIKKIPGPRALGVRIRKIVERLRELSGESTKNTMEYPKRRRKRDLR